MLLISIPLTAQISFWNKYMGGSGFDLAKNLIFNADGSLVIAGEVYSQDGLGEDNHAPASSDVVIFKYATQDVYFWRYTYGGSGMDEISELIETDDGGYVFIGTTDSQDGDVGGTKGELDIWVARLDDLGRLIWSRTYGGSGNDRGFAIVQTPDGGFLIGGESGSVTDDMKSRHHGGLDSWIARLDRNGRIIWEKHFGGTSNERVCRLHALENDGYLVLNASNSANGDKLEALGKKDIWAFGMDAAGNMSWQAVYGGENNDDVYASRMDPEGNIVVAGTTFSHSVHIRNQQGKGDAWLFKINPQGELIWSRNYGGSKADGANDVYPTYDGGYIVAGITRSYDGNVDLNNGYYDGWVIKTDRNGGVIWNRALGYAGKDGFSQVVEVPRGGFLAAGFSEQVVDGLRLPGHAGALDFWLCNFSDPRREGVKPFVTPPMMIGKVVDANTGRPVGAEVSITDSRNLERLGRAQSDPADGGFMMVLPTYGLASINALAQGYLFYGEDIYLDTLQRKTSTTRTIELRPIQIGSTLVLENIYFDVGKWDLLPPSYPELERLVSFMNLNPRVMIEVSGHTDNTGNADEKVELSLNRANAVRDYLLSKGIAENRLRVRGFGMYRPIASNDTYLGRQKNRRVEFEVINK